MLARTLVPQTLGTSQLAAAGLQGRNVSHGLRQLQQPYSSAAARWLAHRGHVPQASKDRETESAATVTSPQAVPAVSAAVAQPQAVAPPSSAAAAIPEPASQAFGQLPGPRGQRKPWARPRKTQQRAPHNGAVQPSMQPPVQQQGQVPAVQRMPVAELAQGNVMLQGTVSTITYASEDGFKIAKLRDVEGTTDASAPADAQQGGAAALAAAAKSSGRRKSGSTPLAVTGNMPDVKKRDEVDIRGEWFNHSKFGWQVKVLHHTVILPSDPTTLLIQYIPGVGPATAERIVQGLEGSNVKEVLSSSDAVQRLSAIKGIGEATAARIKEEWDKNTGGYEASAWLREKKIPNSVIKNLLRRHGATVRDMATKNPYALIDPRTGFTLQHAEAVAASIEFHCGAPERAAAVLHHELRAAVRYSSSYSMHWQQLQENALRKLVELGQQFNRHWPRKLGLRDGAELLLQNGRVVIEEIRSIPTGQQAAHQLTAAAAVGVDSQSQLQLLQQHQHEFVRVHGDWPDNALFMLYELYYVEQDVINFYVDRSAACHEVLAELHEDYDDRSSSSDGSSSDGSSSSGGTLPYPLAPITSEASEMIARCEKELSAELDREVVLNEGQRHALMLAALVGLPAVVLTGGPGCGKTLISQAVARTWLDNEEVLGMAAPTGRAAQRLQEMVTGGKYNATASTIHRLLGFRPYKADAAGSGAAADAVEAALSLGMQCTYGSMQNLEATKLLIDEVSMMDLPMAAALFNAIDWYSSLLLVGDPDQLPPVGPGQPLAAVLAAGLLPCIDLRQIYRTAAGSAIVRAAHDINQGLFPNITTWDISPAIPAQDLAAHLAQVAVDPANGSLQLPSNALFLRLPDGVEPQTVADTLLQTVQQLVPQLQCEPHLHVQVLSPTKRRTCGTAALNARLQQLLNPPASSKQELHGRGHAHTAQTQGSSGSPSSSPVWRTGDRVIHLQNDPERDVYNGDLGYIEAVNPAYGSLTVRYPPRGSTAGRVHVVKYSSMDIHEQLQLAWAITVHKAQGGEFPIVLMPLEMSAGTLLLRRPLLYTAVSRAKQLLVLVGTQEALEHCLHNTVGGGSTEGSGWLADMQKNRLAMKLKAAAAARGLKPFPRLVYREDGWHTETQ